MEKYGKPYTKKIKDCVENLLKDYPIAKDEKDPVDLELSKGCTDNTNLVRIGASLNAPGQCLFNPQTMVNPF